MFRAECKRNVVSTVSVRPRRCFIHEYGSDERTVRASPVYLAEILKKAMYKDE